jgi:hypothetical protein
MMAASYLETLSKFSSKVVFAACDRLRKRVRPFPPSAGELYGECEKVEEFEATKRSVNDVKFRRIEFRRPQTVERASYTVQQLADWSLCINHASPPYVLRVDAQGSPLRVPDGLPGAGSLVEYGYLTPAEAQAAQELRARKSKERYRDAAE